MSEPKEQTKIDYKNLNSDKIVDDVINAATANSIANIISKNGFTFNSKNIGILLLLTSLSDIKKIVVEIIEFTKKYLFEHFSWIVTQIPDYIMNSIIIKHINSYLCKEHNIQNNIIQKPSKIEYKLNISNQEIIIALINYINNNKSLGKCNKELISKNYIGFSDAEEEYLYYNINMNDNVEIILNQNIKYINGKYNNTSKNDKKNDKKNDVIIIDNLVNYFYDCKYYKKNEWTTKIININENRKFTDYRDPIFSDLEYCNNIIYFENIILDIIKRSKYKNIFSKNKEYYNTYFPIIINFFSDIIELNNAIGGIKYYSSCGKFLILEKLNLHIKVVKNNVPKDITLCNSFYYHSLYDDKYEKNPIDNNIIDLFYKSSPSSINSDNNHKTSITFKTTNKTLNLYEYSDTLLNNAFEFYKSQQSSQKIKIFNLSIDKSFKENKKDNPDYETFKKNKKEILEEIKDIEYKDIKTEIMKQFKNPPPQFLIDHEEIINVKSDFVSEQSKPIDTLYLRKDDMFQLKSVLNNFDNCSEIYKELGIRKKLGLMFHGVPGTGKSTSIVTIASYLKKDIYYLNMNTIKTNAELQMIFDYVLKNCSKTGIIVIEEIEKQTDIVFKDHELKHETITDILDKKEGKLNLSYFLNLLDGTLSQEETVYIMTTNHIDKLEPALYRSGRIDKIIEFKTCDKYQIEIIFERIMKRKINSDVLESIPEDTFTPADIIFHLVSYIYESQLDDKTIMENFMTNP